MSKVIFKQTNKKISINKAIELGIKSDPQKFKFDFIIDTKTKKKINSKTASKRLREKYDDKSGMTPELNSGAKNYSLYVREPSSILLPHNNVFNIMTGRIINRPTILKKTNEYNEKISKGLFFREPIVDEKLRRTEEEKSENKKIQENNITVGVEMFISDDIRLKYINLFNVKNKSLKEVKTMARDILYKKGYGRISAMWGAVFYDILNTQLSDEVEVFKKMLINDIKYFKINYDIKSNNDLIDFNCVYHALTSVLGSSLGKKTKEQLKKINVWNVESLIKFLMDNNINFKFYYKNFLLYAENITNSKKKILYGLLKNEHLYIIDKKELSTIHNNNKKRIEIDNIIYSNDLHKVIKDNIETFPCEFFDVDKKMVDVDNHTYKHFINTCIFNKIKYTNDPDIVSSYNLYNKFIDVMIDPNYKITSPLLNIAEVEKLRSIYTYFLQSPSPIIYNYSNDIDGDHCIDKNGAYLNSLLSLDCLPVINGECLILDYDGETDKTNFYYINKILKNDYNNYNVGWCSGYRIIDFNDVIITKFLSPELVKNPYKDLLLKMYEQDPTLTKTIIKHFIGVTQSEPTSRIYYNEILKTPHGYEKEELIKINNDIYISFSHYEHNILYVPSLLPIAHYVIDNSINILFEKIKEIKTKGGIICKINTDSITYKGDFVIPNLNKTDIKGWKDETIKKNYIMVNHQKIYNFNLLDNVEDIKIQYQKPYNQYYNFDYTKNLLFDCSAGAGKTTLILNDIIPHLLDVGVDIDKILILGATHKALGEYYNITEEQKKIFKTDKLHVRTIAHYTMTNKQFDKEFRSYQIIIIDEVALLDQYHYSYLYKNLISGQILYGFGDTTQNNPVLCNMQPLKNELIYKCFFDGYMVLDNNWRNNFTKEDYNNMKTLKYKLKKNIKSLIEKYTDHNICIKNDTKEKINLKIINDKKYNDVYGERYFKTSSETGYKPFIIGQGCLITSINNNLSKKGIYNNTIFKIDNYNNDNITLINNISNEKLILTLQEFNKNFDYGYAYTDYRIQGASIPINNISFFDWDLICKNGTKLYTCLSRIKEKLIKNPEPYNIIKKEDIKISYLD